MSMNRAGNAGALKPDEVAGLVVEPALRASVFAQGATQIPFSSANLRIPRVADGSASWTAEGAEIGVSDVAISEVVAPAKSLKALTFLSNELVSDGNPNTLELIGSAAARQIAAELDEAAFGNTTTNGPAGIESVTGLAYTSSVVLPEPGEAEWEFPGALDPINYAIAAITSQGYQPNFLVTDPDTWAALSILKTGANSNVPLLQPDATQGIGRQIAGLQVLVSGKVTPGTIYVWDSSVIILGVRQDAELVVSEDAAFSSDRVAIRAVARFAVAHPAPLGVAKLTVESGS